jgi:hypothetical protein
MKRTKTRHKKRGKTRKSVNGGGASYNQNIYTSDFISTQPNLDASFKDVGVIHITDSTGISAVRGTLTGFANIIGQKGFDNGPIDDLRNKTLGKLDQLINDAANRFKKQYKACNVRMELDTSNPALIYHHIYGTLLEKRTTNI